MRWWKGLSRKGKFITLGVAAAVVVVCIIGALTGETGPSSDILKTNPYEAGLEVGAKARQKALEHPLGEKILQDNSSELGEELAERAGLRPGSTDAASFGAGYIAGCYGAEPQNK